MNRAVKITKPNLGIAAARKGPWSQTEGAGAANPLTLTPVYGFRDGRQETVAYFHDSEAAIDFVQAMLGKRNLYLAPSLPIHPPEGWCGVEM